MKILWIVNTIFPVPANRVGLKTTVFGGWLNSLQQALEKSRKIDRLAIATVYNGKDLKKIIDKNSIYYLIPSKNFYKYSIALENYFLQIYDDFKPDLVHVHGTEYPHSLAAIKCSNSIKTIVSIQGLVSICGKKDIYNAGINNCELLSSITLRDIVKKDFLFLQYRKFLKRGSFEKEALKKCNYIVGRTSWDRAYAYDISHQNKYEVCNESLRATFYNNDWNIKNIEKHSIFVSQASYPIKGFHILLKSASILKEKYPNLKIYVAGDDIIKSNSNCFSNKIKLTGYGKYILKLMKKYELNDCVTFLGLLNEKEMVTSLLKANVFVQASSIENSPNSLGEAMLIGMPCVASYVGGTADMLFDKKEGYLYPFGDYAMLAYYISKIFDKDNIAVELGKSAQKHAKITHSVENNANQMLEIYNKVINK